MKLNMIQWCFIVNGKEAKTNKYKKKGIHEVLVEG